MNKIMIHDPGQKLIKIKDEKYGEIFQMDGSKLEELEKNEEKMENIYQTIRLDFTGYNSDILEKRDILRELTQSIPARVREKYNF